MKKTIIILMLLPIIVSGQTNKKSSQSRKNNYKYECGINAFSLTKWRKDRYVYRSKSSLNSNLFPGVYLKRHFNKNAIRLSFDYRIIKLDDENEYFTQSGKTKLGEVKIGYEREFMTKRLRPYINFDLSYYHSRSKGIYERFNGDACDAWTDMEFDNKLTEYSLCPGSGMKFFITKRIILSYEFNLQFGLSKDSNIFGYGRSYKFFRFNPVRHLGISMFF
ncbi:hypothetical protein ACFLQ5_00145 [Bacteroidota bacterium]